MIVETNERTKLEAFTPGNLTFDINELNPDREGVLNLDSLCLNYEGKQITISNPITLVSSNRCKLTCTRILISAVNVVIRGFDLEGSIVCRESQRVKIVDCNLTKGDTGSGACIVCTGSKEVLIEDCKISDSLTSGIYVEHGSSVVLDKVSIFDMEETLLAISNSTVIINKCNLTGSQHNGIHALSSSNVTIQNSTISNTVFPAIFIIESKVAINNNEIHHIEQNGITLNRTTEASMEGNKIYAVGASAISLCCESKATINNNEIEKISGNAIYVAESSHVVATNNKLLCNKYPAIAILNDCIGYIYSNTIDTIDRSGICSRGASKIIISNNNISNVKECGISISDTNEAKISNNKIYQCSISGVETYNNSNCTASENEMTKIGDYGFLVYAGAKINVVNNIVRNAKRAFAQMKWKGSGSFVDNKAESCGRLFEGPTSSFFFFKNNSPFADITNDKTRLVHGMIYEEPYSDTKNAMCLKCQKNPRDCFFQICGHKVFCEKCAKEVLEKKGSCPLCRFAVEAITTGFSPSDDQECIICSGNTADCIVMPCGHMGFCSDCLKKWFNSNSSCPFCRIEPSFYKKIITTI